MFCIAARPRVHCVSIDSVVLFPTIPYRSQVTAMGKKSVLTYQCGLARTLHAVQS